MALVGGMENRRVPLRSTVSTRAPGAAPREVCNAAKASTRAPRQRQGVCGAPARCGPLMRSLGYPRVARVLVCAALCGGGCRELRVPVIGRRPSCSKHLRAEGSVQNPAEHHRVPGYVWLSLARMHARRHQTYHRVRRHLPPNRAGMSSGM